MWSMIIRDSSIGNLDSSDQATKKLVEKNSVGQRRDDLFVGIVVVAAVDVVIEN